MSKIACAAITWGDMKTSEDIFKVLRDMKDCGYDGAEMGTLNAMMIENKSKLDEIGIQFFAGHTGGDFRSCDITVEIDNMKKIAEKVFALGGEFIFISGSFYRNKTADDYKKDAEIYNKFGAVVKDAGLEFCYHNHHWEFKNNHTGLDILTKEMDPDLVGLVPDLGWVMRGGVEPVDFLKEFGDRVKAMHFKEFTFDDHFTELGKGVVDFESAYKYIKDRNLWIVAEQDTCAGKPVDSAKQNIQYLRNLSAGY